MTTTTRERPILFSGPMVNAILEDRKTQTRRVIFKDDPGDHMPWRVGGTHWQDGDDPLNCPYGSPGDRLWAREVFLPIKGPHYQYDAPIRDATYVCYRDGSQKFKANDHYYQEPPRERLNWPSTVKWRPSIFMPRWASRITLEVTGVKVERLQEITHEDALAEGCQGYDWVARSPMIVGPHTDSGELPVEEFERRWDQINGKKHPWSSNCWVWVVSFRRLPCPN